jgi:hypothetical protein
MPSNPAHVDAVADPRPGSKGYLKWYWTAGPGLAKWRLSPHPWTALKRELRGKVPAAYLDATVSKWFEDVFGYPSGARKGKNPIGKG